MTNEKKIKNVGRKHFLKRTYILIIRLLKREKNKEKRRVRV